MIDKKYVAGFIDGEGYLGIMNRSHYKLGQFYMPVIKVAQKAVDSLVLELIKEKYGGHLSKERVHGGNTNNTRMWELKGSNKLRELLTDILPYLLVKKKQAELMLKYLSTPKLTNNTALKKNVEIKLIRDKCYSELRVLNRRGVAETE